MKPVLTTSESLLATALSFFAVSLLAACVGMLTLPGCTVTDRGVPSQEGVFMGDATLFYAEESLPILTETIGNVLKWEEANRSILAEHVPEVVEFCNDLRDKAPPAIRDATAATVAYRQALQRFQSAGISGDVSPPDPDEINSTIASVNSLAIAAMTVMARNRASTAE